MLKSCSPAPRPLSRRTFLRGTGVAMALPLLDGMIPALTLSTALYPRAGVDAPFAQAAIAAARAEGVSPVVTKTVIELTDRLTRMLKTRAR